MSQPVHQLVRRPGRAVAAVLAATLAGVLALGAFAVTLAGPAQAGTASADCTQARAELGQARAAAARSTAALGKARARVQHARSHPARTRLQRHLRQARRVVRLDRAWRGQARRAYDDCRNAPAPVATPPATPAPSTPPAADKPCLPIQLPGLPQLCSPL